MEAPRLELVALAYGALLLVQEDAVSELLDENVQGLGLVGVAVVLLALQLLPDVVHVLAFQAQVPWHSALPKVTRGAGGQAGLLARSGDRGRGRRWGARKAGCARA